MHKPKKSLRVREITAWHSAFFSPHAGPHVRTRQCEHSLFIDVWTFGAGPQCGSACPHAPVWMHLNFAMRWGTASKGASSRRTTPKWDSSLSGRWMGHLLSGGHDGIMLPINPRGLNGPFYFFLPHVFFTKYTNTLLISNAKLIKWVVERLYTNSKLSYDLMIFKIPLASLSPWK